jgi:hypothetical protein
MLAIKWYTKLEQKQSERRALQHTAIARERQRECKVLEKHLQNESRAKAKREQSEIRARARADY